MFFARCQTPNLSGWMYSTQALRPNVNAATPTRGSSAQDRTKGILDSPDSSSSELADIVSPLRNHAGTKPHSLD